MVDNELIYEGSNKNRFIKGVHTSYGMKPPSQIKKNSVAIEAMAKLNLSIQNYEELWQQCLLPTPEMASKIEKSAIKHINLYLIDYNSIIHRFGDANDPIAKEILKPGLISGQIGVNFNSNTFSLAPEHISAFANNDEIMNILSRLCFRANRETMHLLNNTTSFLINKNHTAPKISSIDKMFMPLIDGFDKLPTKQTSFISFNGVYSNEHYQTKTSQDQSLSTNESIFYNALVNVLVCFSDYISI